MAKKKAVLILALLLVAVVGGYSVYWHYAAGVLRQVVATWIAGAERQGIEVRTDALEVGGYPFRLEVSARNLDLVRPDGAALAAGDLTAFARPWNYFDIRIASQGSQLLRVPVGPGLVEVAGAALEGRAQLTRDGRLRQLDLDAIDLSARPGGREGPRFTLERLAFSVGGLDARPADASVVGLHATVAMRALGLPAGLDSALGSTVDRLALELALLGAVPDPTSPDSLRAWQQGGGVVEVTVLDLLWGPLAVAAEGKIGLDRDLQPDGALTAQITGYRETIDAMAQAGWIDRNGARLARVALDLLAERPAGAGRPVLTAPILIRERFLTVGPVPVLSLPRIQWGS